MTDPSRPLPARLPQRREQTIEALCAHFARDQLDTAELERRLDLAHRAQSPAELDALLADLPVPANPPIQAFPDTSVPAPATHPSERQIVAAVMGGAERKGAWTPARHLYAIAWMGGIELDFREARLAPGVTHVEVLAIMGGVEILVPPGVRVDCQGIGIMGGFEGRDQTGELIHPDAPTLRINGLALMGGIEVVSRLPGESRSAAKRRLREERRQRRLEQG